MDNGPESRSARAPFSQTYQELPRTTKNKNEREHRRIWGLLENKGRRNTILQMAENFNYDGTLLMTYAGSDLDLIMVW